MSTVSQVLRDNRFAFPIRLYELQREFESRYPYAIANGHCELNRLGWSAEGCEICAPIGCRRLAGLAWLNTVVAVAIGSRPATVRAYVVSSFSDRRALQGAAPPTGRIELSSLHLSWSNDKRNQCPHRGQTRTNPARLRRAGSPSRSAPSLVSAFQNVPRQRGGRQGSR